MDNQPPSPDQQPISPQPPTPTVYPAVNPAPAPMPQQPIYPQPIVGQGSAYDPQGLANKSPQWTNSSSGLSAQYGAISLGLGVFSILLFIVLIFNPGLVKTETAGIVWFIVFLVMSAISTVLGILSQRNKATINLLGLVGMIVSIIVTINCIIIGSYYIKTRLEIKKLQKDIKNNSSSYDYDYSTD